ncbi:MAG: precorrin-6A/cobalt-precorrin-6A reductase [Candidatus Endobugula sp.]|jgi:precorrin-6A/cobalt-precorrin-6A reductase
MILLLGGTADGRVLAETLHQQGIPIIYSIAGLVRVPTVACEILTGGFTPLGGLEHVIKEKNIQAILDVTHPYAELMSTKAVTAARQCDIPYWRFHREEWRAEKGDDWHMLNDWQEAFPLLENKQSVLLSAGQLDQAFMDTLAANNTNNSLVSKRVSKRVPKRVPKRVSKRVSKRVPKRVPERVPQTQLLRTAVEPKTVLPPSMQWIKAIGPFSYDDELALLQQHNIDVIVSKNSGGDATVAKLRAARAMGIPVLMLKRPLLPNGDKTFFSRQECEQFIIKNMAGKHDAL